MEFQTADGSIDNFVSISWHLANDTNVPVYSVSNAVYNDKKDYFDGKEYFYFSFVQDDVMQMLRAYAVPGTHPKLDWAFSF